MDEQLIKAMKKQSFWLRVTAFCMAGIFMVTLITAIILVPKVTKVLNDATVTLEEADIAVQELNTTAKQLSKLDFEGLMDDTQKLVNESSEGIAQALGKLEAIDIDGLNSAISDLSAVVSPLARLFGK